MKKIVCIFPMRRSANNIAKKLMTFVSILNKKKEIAVLFPDWVHIIQIIKDLDFTSNL